MQVWCEDRFVGNLNIAVEPFQSHLRMISMDEETMPSPFVEVGMNSSWDTSPAFKNYAYKIEELRAMVRVDDFATDSDRAEMIRQVQLRYHIPADAKMMTTPLDLDGSTRHVWKWKGIKVDTAGAERLFDHPDFEPV